MRTSTWAVDIAIYRHQDYDTPEVHAVDVTLTYRENEAWETVLYALKRAAEAEVLAQLTAPGVDFEWDVLDVYEYATDETDSESGTDGPPAP